MGIRANLPLLRIDFGRLVLNVLVFCLVFCGILAKSQETTPDNSITVTGGAVVVDYHCEELLTQAPEISRQVKNSVLPLAKKTARRKVERPSKIAQSGKIKIKKLSQQPPKSEEKIAPIESPHTFTESGNGTCFFVIPLQDFSKAVLAQFYERLQKTDFSVEKTFFFTTDSQFIHEHYYGVFSVRPPPFI